MDDLTLACALLFMLAVVMIFTALFSSSDLFSNRGVQYRSALRFFSLAWVKAGEGSRTVAKGIAAGAGVIALLCTIGHSLILFPVIALALALLANICINIWIEARGGARAEQYWKVQLRSPLAMHFEPPKLKAVMPAREVTAISERWKLACMRAGLENIADVSGRVSTPPIVRSSERELIVNPLGFNEHDFEKVIDKLSATLGKKIYNIALIEHGKMRIMLEEKPLPEMLTLAELDFKQGVMFGISAMGAVILPPHKWPHAMVAGTSGSGKSIFLRFLCYQFIKFYPRAVIAIIDVKREDFEVFERWPNFVRARNAEHLTAIAKHLEQERNRRERTRRKDWEEVFFIIDEANEVIRKQNSRNVERLLTMSRSADMHIVLCQQRSTISDTAVTGVMRANASMRICFRVDNAPDSRVMLNTAAGTKIPMIPGRAIVLDRQTGKNVTIQSPMVRTADVDHLIDEMMPQCREQKLALDLRELILQTDAKESEV